jgi:hypothetical protein
MSKVFVDKVPFISSNIVKGYLDLRRVFICIIKRFMCEMGRTVFNRVFESLRFPT